MLKTASRRASPFSKTSECLPPALASALSCVHASLRGLSDCSPLSDGLGVLNGLVARILRPPLRRH